VSQSITQKVALVGTPNAGKTALFNLLTNSRQRVANYAGVTVESVEADLVHSKSASTLVDLPGAYSLHPFTEEEKVLRDAVKSGSFSKMILVVDATQPERAIRFLVEVLNATSVPAVVAFNMMDIAEARGYRYDLDLLSSLLGVPVVATSAVRKKGTTDLIRQLDHLDSDVKRELNAFYPSQEAAADGRMSPILEFYKKSDVILKQVLLKKGGVDRRSEWIDRYVLHPFWGILILVAVLGVCFQLMFNVAQVPMDWIDSGMGALSTLVSSFPLPDLLKSFLVDGILAGVGGTIVFLPQILILFALILFLEDFGFMARAVFLLDHWMGKVGLHGRAFLPILSSYACAVPGIMATKSIESRRDRIVTIMMIPVTTCSARVPVYTLLIGAFIPNTVVFAGLKLQGLVMLGLYLAGTIFALLSGAILKQFFFKGPRMPLFIELPSYKWPSLRSIAKGLLYRAKLFLVRVGTVILALSVVIWAMVTFPNKEKSIAYDLGHAIEPIMRPIGFDWKISMAMIPTFAAREVMVSALSTVYAVEDVAADAATDPAAEESDKLSETIKKEWPLATGFSLLVWFIFAPQCISTLSAIRRELQSTKWMVFLTLYLFLLAYFAAWITHTIALRI
jgi:ferrous iron transport protein B